MASAAVRSKTVVLPLFVVAPIYRGWSLFCHAVPSVLSSFAVIPP